MATESITLLKNQLQSAKKSLVFLETQHAKTLNGLHDEINVLQKRCNELTYNLTMNEKQAYSDVIQEKLESLQMDAINSAEEKVLLVQQLEEKDLYILELEKKFKLCEVSHISDIKKQHHIVTTLTNEVDENSTTIAYLTTQLHQAQSKLKIMEERKISKNIYRDSSISELANLKTPVPPLKPSSSEQRRRNRRSVNSEDLQMLSTKHKLRIPPRRSLDSVDSSILLNEGNIRPQSSSSRFISSVQSVGLDDNTTFIEANYPCYNQQTTRSPKPPSVLPPITKPITFTDGSVCTTCVEQETFQSHLSKSSSPLYSLPTPLSKVCTKPEKHSTNIKRGLHKI